MRPHGKAEIAKQAAILVPIVEIQIEPALVYTKRSKYLTNHKSQISFPGGNSDETDSGPEQTALRTIENDNLSYLNIYMACTKMLVW